MIKIVVKSFIMYKLLVILFIIHRFCFPSNATFHFLILVGGPLVILIGDMIFLSAFLDVISIFMSTMSFLAQLDFGILVLPNAFLYL